MHTHTYPSKIVSLVFVAAVAAEQELPAQVTALLFPEHRNFPKHTRCDHSIE